MAPFARTLPGLLAAASLSVAAGSVLAQSGAADSTGGAGSCGPAIAHFERVVGADAETGNVNRSVYARITADLKTVKAMCAAGRDAEARSKLAAVRARYGYP